MKKYYQIVKKTETKKIAEYLTKNGQVLLPLLDLLESSRMALDELIDVMGRASIEAVLQLSARNIAGEKHQGKKGGEVNWFGKQKGTVRLSDRKLRVDKPRLRRKGKGSRKEVEIPAYAAMNSGESMSRRILEILMRNVTTRNYKHVIPEMAETVGVSKSSISREFIEASGKELERLAERRFDDVKMLIIYMDGIVFGDYHVIGAIGVDTDGKKHVLGLVEGASENAASATALLESIVSRGIDPARNYLFVIDGSKALRAAIKRVFGLESPVQRCRHHKIQNVYTKLPKELGEQVKSVMKAAYRLPYKEGIQKLRHQADWLSERYPDAARSLLEGLEETFTINRLELSSSLRLCLGTTNIIESPHSGVRMRTRRVTKWKNGKMVLRWAASAFLAAEKNFRRIQGFRDLWMLDAILNDKIDLDRKGCVA